MNRKNDNLYQTLSIIQEKIKDMDKRLKKLEAHGIHFDQQLQYEGLPAELGLTIPADKQILAYGAYGVEGDIIIEGHLVVL